MIAKRVIKAGKSDFRILSRYVRDMKGKGEKVRHAWGTNCADEADIDLAEIEITATQDLNTRSKIDKTYHLVISLAPGEDLTNEQFKNVEYYFCDAIGLSEHQRVCAIHTDTSSIHMHIAISKIHPLKLTAIEPYYDKYKLQDSCRELERRFGLIPGISEEKNRSKHQKDAFQKLQSFESYVKDKFSSSLAESQDSCRSWIEFQSELGKFNLEMREHGSGLVMSHREMPLYIKASSIDKTLSKQSLEKRFGGFERSEWKGDPDESYKPGPTATSNSSRTLYQAYLLQKETAYEKRSDARLKNREDLKKKLDDIKERYANQRHELQKDSLIAKGRKRLIYQKLTTHMKEEIFEVKAEYSGQMEKIKVDTPISTWKDWIFEQANQGNESALGVLRHGMKDHIDKGLGEFKGDGNDRMFDGLPRIIFKDGTVQYKISEGGFIDRGDSIVVNSLNPKVLELAQRCADSKFGSSKTLSGSEAFLTEVANLSRPTVTKPTSKNLEITR